MQRILRSLVVAVVAGCLIHAGSIRAPVQAGERFQWLEDDSGLLDTQTGLVWGYDLNSTGGFIKYLLTGEWAGGSNSTWEWAMNLNIGCHDFGDTPICTYQEFSNWYFDRDDDDWRLPTIEEMEAAYSAGIADYLDGNPHPDVDDYNPWSWMWSMTKGPKKRGSDSAYALQFATGDVNNWSVGSPINAFVVRGVAPPSDNSPGGGKGKKK